MNTPRTQQIPSNILGNSVQGAVTTLFLTTLLLLLWPRDAFALDMEFYTYNGFLPVVTAFKKIALIFSDNGYKTLFISIVILSIFLGGATTFGRLLMGRQQGSSLAWAWPIGMGVIFYLGVVVPTGSLTIYDPVLNKAEKVPGIPNAVVAVAGITNLVERGIIDIIHTSEDVKSYKTYGSGTGFDLLHKACSGDLKLGDSNLQTSFQNYLRNCVFFEILRPGTDLTVDGIVHGNRDFMKELAKATHPSIYMVYHDPSSGGQGESCTCKEAWEKMTPLLTSPQTTQNMLRGICGRAGFNPDDPEQLQKCKSTIGNFGTFVGSDGKTILTSELVLRQIGMANLLNQELQHDSFNRASSTIANRNIMTQGLSAAVVSEQWIPVARAVLIAISVGMVPFIALFFPTPFIGPALSLFVGMQLWIMCWGISDAIIYSLTFDYAANAFEALRQSQFGYNAILLLPDATARALSLLGSARLIGLSLATVLSAYLFKVGGHALVAMGSSFSGTIQSGASAGAPVQTFEGMNQALSSQNMDPGVWKNYDNREYIRGMQQSMGQGFGTVAGLEQQRRTIEQATGRRTPYQAMLQAREHGHSNITDSLTGDAIELFSVEGGGFRQNFNLAEGWGKLDEKGDITDGGFYTKHYKVIADENTRTKQDLNVAEERSVARQEAWSDTKQVTEQNGYTKEEVGIVEKNKILQHEKAIRNAESLGERFSDNVKKRLGIGVPGGFGMTAEAGFDRTTAESYDKLLTTEERGQVARIERKGRLQSLRNYNSKTEHESWEHKLYGGELFADVRRLSNSISQERGFSTSKTHDMAVTMIKKTLRTGMAKNPRDAIQKIARGEIDGDMLFKEVADEMYGKGNYKISIDEKVAAAKKSISPPESTVKQEVEDKLNAPTNVPSGGSFGGGKGLSREVNSHEFDKKWQGATDKIHKQEEGLKRNFVKKGASEIVAGVGQTAIDLKEIGKNVVQAVRDPEKAAERRKNDPVVARAQKVWKDLVEKDKK